jgi:hypothetical protein
MIDKNTHEIKQDEDKVVYKTLEEIGEDLPDHTPRFILLSYPLTLVRPPSASLVHSYEPRAGATANKSTAIWTSFSPLRHVVLPPDHGEQ